MDNEHRWIKVTSCDTGRRVAINLGNVVCVCENDRDDVYNGRRSTIYFSDSTSMVVYDSFDEIGEKIV